MRMIKMTIRMMMRTHKCTDDEDENDVDDNEDEDVKEAEIHEETTNDE